MPNPIMNMAMNLLRNNPNIANNPRNREMIDALSSGDDTRCKQIAENLCQSYGTTPEEAIKKARQFFNV